MRKAMVAALLGMALAGSPAWATQWAQEMFAQSDHDFGTVARAATAEYEFKLTNPFREDVPAGRGRRYSAALTFSADPGPEQREPNTCYASTTRLGKRNQALFLLYRTTGSELG